MMLGLIVWLRKFVMARIWQVKSLTKIWRQKFGKKVTEDLATQMLKFVKFW